MPTSRHYPSNQRLHRPLILTEDEWQELAGAVERSRHATPQDFACKALNLLSMRIEAQAANRTSNGLAGAPRRLPTYSPLDLASATRVILVELAVDELLSQDSIATIAHRTAIDVFRSACFSYIDELQKPLDPIIERSLERVHNPDSGDRRPVKKLNVGLRLSGAQVDMAAALAVIDGTTMGDQFHVAWEYYCQERLRDPEAEMKLLTIMKNGCKSCLQSNNKRMTKNQRSIVVAGF